MSTHRNKGALNSRLLSQDDITDVISEGASNNTFAS